jgi:hypothetical protein
MIGSETAAQDDVVGPALEWDLSVGNCFMLVHPPTPWS